MQLQVSLVPEPKRGLWILPCDTVAECGRAKAEPEPRAVEQQGWLELFERTLGDIAKQHALVLVLG